MENIIIVHCNFINNKAKQKSKNCVFKDESIKNIKFQYCEGTMYSVQNIIANKSQCCKG